MIITYISSYLSLLEASGWTPCVLNINSFASAFLYSMESQHTIGYGVRAPTEECPEAVFVMCMQAICGVLIQAFMGGIVFAKLTRGKARQHTLIFSKHATVSRRSGAGLCLMFRVGDMRKSHIIGASIRAQLIRSRWDKQCGSIRQYQSELKLSVDDCGADLFFIWPMSVVHYIGPESPLYDMSYLDLVQNSFEIVVILEGTVESTGQSIQARSSYLNSEIVWGAEFEPVIFYNKQKHSYEIDYDQFNATVSVDAPLQSSRELAEREAELQELCRRKVKEDEAATVTEQRRPSEAERFDGGAGQLCTLSVEHEKLLQNGRGVTMC